MLAVERQIQEAFAEQRMAVKPETLDHLEERISCLRSEYQIMLAVSDERRRQDAKFGDQYGLPYDSQEHTHITAENERFKCQRAFDQDRGSWTHILAEEVGEALDEARAGNADALRTELIQVAAVAVAWAEAIDRSLA